MRRILTALAAVLLLAGFTGAAMAQSPSQSSRGGSAANTNEPGDHGQPPGDCEDGQDNDGDQLVDEADPACQQPGCRPSTQQPNKCHEADDEGPAPDDCADGIDNEPDGFTDADDPDCQPGGSGDETNDDSDDADDCADGIDNEPDGFTDADDPDCQPGGSGDETNDDSGGADDCADGIDNEPDGFTDADDPDCQPGGSGDETNDDSGGGAADPCSSPGLLTDPTLGQTLWDGGLQIPPLTEDPYPDGALSGPLSQAADGTPLQPVFLEAGCAVDLLIDGSVGGDL